jgi:hypothetical protein
MYRVSEQIVEIMQIEFLQRCSNPIMSIKFEEHINTFTVTRLKLIEARVRIVFPNTNIIKTYAVRFELTCFTVKEHLLYRRISIFVRMNTLQIPCKINVIIIRKIISKHYAQGI